MSMYVVYDPALDLYLAEPVRVASASAGRGPPVEWVADSDHALRLERAAAEHAAGAFLGSIVVALEDLWKWGWAKRAGAEG